jgi:hypothetical protein
MNSRQWAITETVVRRQLFIVNYSDAYTYSIFSKTPFIIPFSCTGRNGSVFAGTEQLYSTDFFRKSDELRIGGYL